jgi:hypothetical protein
LSPELKGSAQVAVGVSQGQISVTPDVPGIAAVSVSSLKTSAPAADQIEGVLRTTKAYYDEQAKVSATFRVTNSVEHTSTTSGIPVVMIASFGSETVPSSPVTCGGRNNGLCDISVSIPDGWFDNGGEMTVTYKFNSGSDTAEKALGKVTAVKRPTALPTDAENTIYTTLPSYDLFTGDQFTVTVRSLFNVFLLTAEVNIACDPSLQISQRCRYIFHRCKQERPEGQGCSRWPKGRETKGRTSWVHQGRAHQSNLQGAFGHISQGRSSDNRSWC